MVTFVHMSVIVFINAQELDYSCSTYFGKKKCFSMHLSIFDDVVCLCACM